MELTTIIQDLSVTVEAKTKESADATEQIKQSVTFDFTGCTLETILKKAAASYRIDYQNGYARKHPEKFLYDKYGKARNSVNIVVKEFFKGREKLSEEEKTVRQIMKLYNIDKDQALKVAEYVQHKAQEEKSAKSAKSAK